MKKVLALMFIIMAIMLNSCAQHKTIIDIINPYSEIEIVEDSYVNGSAGRLKLIAVNNSDKIITNVDWTVERISVTHNFKSAAQYVFPNQTLSLAETFLFDSYIKVKINSFEVYTP